MAFAKGENPHRPKKGDSIRVEPIRSKKHIHNIKKIRLFGISRGYNCVKYQYVAWIVDFQLARSQFGKPFSFHQDNNPYPDVSR